MPRSSRRPRPTACLLRRSPAKAEVSSIYALLGRHGADPHRCRRFVTSGKVYEYMATGLPSSRRTPSSTTPRRAEGPPLWTGAPGLDEAGLTESFIKAAHMAGVENTDEEQPRRWPHADQSTREALMSSASRTLSRSRQVTEVLLWLRPASISAYFADTVRKFNAQGARVHLAASSTSTPRASPRNSPRWSSATAHQLRAPSSTAAGPVPPARQGPAWSAQLVEVRGDSCGRSMAARPTSSSRWTSPPSTRCGGSPSRPTAAAEFGLAPALKAVEELKAQGGPAFPVPRPATAKRVARDVRRSVDRLPAQQVRTATPRPLMRSGVGARLWRSADDPRPACP